MIYEVISKIARSLTYITAVILVLGMISESLTRALVNTESDTLLNFQRMIFFSLNAMVLKKIFIYALVWRPFTAGFVHLSIFEVMLLILAS